jgi:ribosomal protein S21
MREIWVLLSELRKREHYEKPSVKLQEEVRGGEKEKVQVAFVIQK